MFKSLIRVTVALALFGVGIVHAQTPLAQLQTELIATWITTVEGEARTRTLRISSVEQKDAGIFLLTAVYGYSDGRQQGVEAEIKQTAQERTLLITTQSGSRISAAQKSDGVFVGTFIPTSGQTKGLRIEKVAENQLQAKIEAVLKGPEIQKPAADVPAQCASFSGKWVGTWTQGSQDSFWVVAVDANCLAKFAYGSTSKFASAPIANGTLSFGAPLCARDGTCSFELHGDELWARYSGGGTAVFRKVQ
ncbi:MAG: hypothetical protein M0P95_11970 [Sulfuritalea sp.]|jgi:hypothetical protein|nr:hypothetical protein [Sulfuritalea sp.]